MENAARKLNVTRYEIVPVSRKERKQKQDLWDKITAIMEEYMISIMSELLDIKHTAAVKTQNVKSGDVPCTCTFPLLV